MRCKLTSRFDGERINSGDSRYQRRLRLGTLWMLLFENTLSLMLPGTPLNYFTTQGTTSPPASSSFFLRALVKLKNLLFKFELIRFHDFQSFTGFSSFGAACGLWQNDKFFSYAMLVFSI